jgi:uncharacterized membrane protein YkvA (DUF1232 family)
MWKRLPLLWTVIRGDAKRVWFALRHPASPGWFRWGLALVALYLVSPIDIVPDFIPFLGVVDDLVVVPMAIRWLLSRLPAEVTGRMDR